MGKVTEHLFDIIRKQVEDRGIVVWYDPEQAHADIVKNLSIPKTEVLQYTNGFFQLRSEIDHFLEYLNEDNRPIDNCGVPPRVVVYVPLDRLRMENALIEIETAGTVLEPGAGVVERNTRLRVIAEQVFNDKISPDQMSKIGRQIEEGRLSLNDLDKMADEVEAVGGVIKLIFGTTAVDEVVLKFVAVSEYDEKLIAKKALPDLAAFFSKVLGTDFDDVEDCQGLRNKFVKVLLLTEFLTAFPKETRPEEMEFFPISEQPTHIKMSVEVCRTWRNRADYRDAYLKAAHSIEKEVGLNALDFVSDKTVKPLADIETFPALEQKLIAFCGKKILSGKVEEILKTAEKRIQSFWSVQEPLFQLRWSILQYAAQTLMLGAELRNELKSAAKDPEKMLTSYVDRENPGCLIDTYYRRLEHHYALLDLEPTGEDIDLEKVVLRVRQDYTKTLELGIEKFVSAMTAADFQIKGHTRQDEIYSKYVYPQIDAGKKTAYILVDALRYEMGREIADELSKEFKIELDAAVAVLPSITSTGMAALLPHANKGIELVRTTAGKTGVAVGSEILKNRSDRIKFLQKQIDKPTAVCKLSGLIKPAKKLREEIEAAELIVVTSQELDRWGEESDGEEEIRIFMEEVLDRLGKAVRRLAALGVECFVVTADHGHLFGETIEGGMRMDPPGGETAELHGRVWIGKGGTVGDGFVRVPASLVGIGGDFELAFPRSLACFKTKGGVKAYCHGGISLQEMALPVIDLQKKILEQPFSTPKVHLEISAPKVTNRFFSVSAVYKEQGLFAAGDIRVKLIVKSDRKEVGAAAMAAYGFEPGTKEIILKNDKPNAVTLMLTETENVVLISIHVLDVISQTELGRLKNIPIDLSF